MPSKHQKSGAAKRSARAARAAEERKAQGKAPAASPGARSFKDLPPAPLGDPGEGVAWFNDVLLVCADQVIRNDDLDLLTKVSLLKDCAAKAGMIRDKAAEQVKIRQILADKKKEEERQANLKPVDTAPPPPVPRPGDKTPP